MDINDKFGIVDSNSTDSIFEMFDGGTEQAVSVTETPKTPSTTDEANPEIIEDGSGTSNDKQSLNDFLENKDAPIIPEVSTEVADDDAGSEEEEVSPFQTISQELVSLGIFNEDEEDPLPTTGEDFAKRFEKEAARKANDNLTNFLAKFGQDRIDAFKAIFVSGVDPKEYFNISSKPDDILNLDMEQESNQKKVVKKYYQEMMGHTEARTEKLIQMLIEDGELDAEAVVALEKFRSSRQNELDRLEQERLNAEQQKVQEKQYFNDNVSKFINSKINDKEIDGLKFDKNIADQVMRTMTQGAWKLQTGEIISDFQKFVLDLSRPENIEIAVKIALLKENNFDFSKIQLKKENIEKDKLFSGLKNKTKIANRNSSTHKVDNFSII